MLKWLLCGVGIVFSGVSLADSSPRGAEFATLPPYCKEKVETTDPVANKAWSDKFGQHNWLHMHHYCYGLNYLINRQYRARTPQDRAWMLGEAVDNINYTLNAATPGFTLLPEMHFNRGRAYRLLGRSQEALNDWWKSVV